MDECVVCQVELCNALVHVVQRLQPVTGRGAKSLIKIA